MTGIFGGLSRQAEGRLLL